MSSAPDPAELARLEHENMIAGEEMLASLSTRSVIQRFDGIAFLAAGLPVRFFNKVVVEGDHATWSGVEAAVALARQRSLPFMVELRSGTDDRFVPLMSRLGLVPTAPADDLSPAMTLSPVPRDPAPALPGYEIVRVEDVAALEDHKQALTNGFEMPPEWAEELITPRALERENATLYTGYAAGVPVATGVGLRTGRTIGVYNISTVPEARRRGYGAAMTRRIVADGAKAGCDVAALQASEMGYSVYERLGFRTVVEYVAFTEPMPAQEADRA